MELLEGTDLGTHLENNGPLAADVAVDYVLQACCGLATAHANGIIHRDLKPSNLFVTDRPGAAPLIRLVDFGISKLLSPLSDSDTPVDTTGSAMFLGSPQYMAPEQMRAPTEIDERTDIWALGAVLYTLVTGTAPFNAPSTPEVFARVLVAPTPELPSNGPAMPPEINGAIRRCLCKAMPDRFPNVSELAYELAPLTAAGETYLARIKVRNRTRTSWPHLAVPYPLTS